MGAVGMTHERPGRMARGNIRDVAYLLQCKYPMLTLYMVNNNLLVDTLVISGDPKTSRYFRLCCINLCDLLSYYYWLMIPV